MHSVQDQASSLGILPTQNERCGGSGQQECEKDYSQSDEDIQRLTREVAYCITCLSDRGSNINWGTSYSLVYRMEVVLPIEVEIPSFRVLREVKLEEAEWVQAWYEQLNFIEEKRLMAICHG